MGLLNRKDSTLHRGYFNEMCKLIGQSVGYQYVTDQQLTIHSEDNSKYSMPIRIDILFDENPSTTTLNKMGWISEIGDQKPIVATMPYDTPNLTVNSRITVESVDGVARPRVFRVTKIVADLEYPDSFTCALVPVFDQIPQRNQYTLVNNEKISQQDSKTTSKDQPANYITGEHVIDSTPQVNIDFENTYSFIDDESSPYSG